MKPVIEPTEEEREVWAAWVAERPPHVRAVAERFSPWQLYRLKSSGHRVTVCAFDEEEDGTVTLRVQVLGRFNFVAFERTVFGIKPEDLEPCDPPAEGELVGSMDLEPEEAVRLMREREAERN